MNEQDRQIRRQWWTVWIVSMLFGFFGLLLQIKYIYSVVMPPNAQYGILIGFFIVMGGLSMACYHCIYKNPGTKFLTFLLLMAVLNLLAIPVFYLKGFMAPQLPIPYFGLIQIISHCLTLCWMIVCWRMRKVNKKLQTLTLEN